MFNELVYKGNTLFSFKSLIKGHLTLIICITIVPSWPDNKLGISCSRCLIPAWKCIKHRGKNSNTLQIKEFLISGFFSLFSSQTSSWSFTKKNTSENLQSPFHFSGISDLVKICTSASNIDKSTWDSNMVPNMVLLISTGSCWENPALKVFFRLGCFHMQQFQSFQHLWH